MTTTNEAKRVPTVAVEIEGRTITLTYANGETDVVNADELPAEILDYAMLHGLKQKLVDAAAISRDPETGRSVSVADKIAAIREVKGRLYAGEWNKRRESGEGSGNGGLLFRALCELYPNKAPESVREFIAGKSKEEQAALRSSPKIAAIIDRIRARKASDIDTDAMLAGL